ncbi:MAG: hypothetical protein WBD25_21225, partial [Terriglobales bacterium]
AEVLGYFISPEYLRPRLLPVLAENPSISEESLDAIAVAGSRSVVEVLLASTRVMSSPRLLEGLKTNANLRPNEIDEIGKKLAAFEAGLQAESEATEVDAPDEVIESTITKFLEENAAELAAEKDTQFQPIGMAFEEEGANASTNTDVAKDAAEKTATAAVEKSAAAAIKTRKPAPVEDRRDSTLQKISKLDIRGRITLAMRGNKEERSILIRDSTKLVSLAVLDSPKVSDGEVEKFALQKNVLESVLRAIPMKRKFAKNYSIIRNLVYNPRTPLDLSLGLMKNLLVHDLKNLSGNKEVSDTIRKVAIRMHRQKAEKKG